MTLLLVLIVLLVLFGGGGATYSRWGATGPAWGSGLLWLLAALALVFLIIRLFQPVVVLP